MYTCTNVVWSSILPCTSLSRVVGDILPVISYPTLTSFIFHSIYGSKASLRFPNTWRVIICVASCWIQKSKIWMDLHMTVTCFLFYFWNIFFLIRNCKMVSGEFDINFQCFLLFTSCFFKFIMYTEMVIHVLSFHKAHFSSTYNPWNRPSFALFFVLCVTRKSKH